MYGTEPLNRSFTVVILKYMLVYFIAAPLFMLKGQYHAIFSNTLKIEKTLFG